MIPPRLNTGPYRLNTVWGTILTGGNENLLKVEGHQINFDEGGNSLQKGCYTSF